MLMIMRTSGITALTLAASTFFAASAVAKNVVVDQTAVSPPTCQTAVKAANRYTTIQAAVTAAVAGDTVLVCPGTYPEQVVIDKWLTVKGVADEVGSTSQLVTITVPAGGLQVNAPATAAYGDVAAQVLAHNAKFINISNMTIDGTLAPADCPANIPAYRSAGVAYINVGESADGVSAGIVQTLVVENHGDTCLEFGQPAIKGVGMLAENSFITFQDSDVHTIKGDGITQQGGGVTIQRNFTQDVWNYGIKVQGDSAALSHVRSNTVIHSETGILVRSGGADVLSNTVGLWVGTGVFVADSALPIVQTNKIVNATVGFWFNETNGALVTGNGVQGAATGIIDTYSGSANGYAPNVIQSNKVNEGAIGLCSYSPGTDVLTGNTFTNVGVTAGTCN
jgi:nitrous oxidase accessory protein NosD